MLDEKLLRLKKEIVNADKYQQQLIGRRAELMKQLFNEHNCKSLDKTDIVLKKYTKIGKKLRQKVSEGLRTLEGKL